jgi:hypothetical protein
MLTDQEIQAAYMTADSAELFARAIEQAVITKLAGVSVEPVAWRNPVDSYSLVTTHQKETNEFQYSDEFLAGHTEPLYTAAAIAAARVQENERCVQALEALWHSNDDSTKKCINAIRALIGKEST